MQRLWASHYWVVIFSLAGLEIILTNALAYWLGYDPQFTIPVTILVILASHTYIYLHVRRRLHTAVEETITRTKDMLKDRVLNNLAQINTSIYLMRRKPESQEARLERIESSVSEITDVVNNLSEAEVDRWHALSTEGTPTD